MLLTSTNVALWCVFRTDLGFRVDGLNVDVEERRGGLSPLFPIHFNDWLLVCLSGLCVRMYSTFDPRRLAERGVAACHERYDTAHQLTNPKTSFTHTRVRVLVHV